MPDAIKILRDLARRCETPAQKRAWINAAAVTLAAAWGGEFKGRSPALAAAAEAIIAEPDPAALARRIAELDELVRDLQDRLIHGKGS